MKTCTKCLEEKSLTEFTRRKGQFKKNGEPMFYSWCKSCKCEAQKARYKKQKLKPKVDPKWLRRY